MHQCLPELKNVMRTKTQRLGCGQKNGTIFTILPEWWNMYERLTFDLLSHAATGLVPYCRTITQLFSVHSRQKHPN